MLTANGWRARARSDRAGPFISADVGRAVYDALANERDAVVSELGLTDERVYVPVGEADTRVRLFVPQFVQYSVPADDELAAFYVVPDDEAGRGEAFRPTGEALFRDFETALSGPVGETPAVLVSQLSDALVEQFGLVTAVRADLDSEGGRVTVGVTDSVYGSVSRIDHPVAWVVGVGFARGLGRAVTVESRASEDERVDVQVTCRWERLKREEKS